MKGSAELTLTFSVAETGVLLQAKVPARAMLTSQDVYLDTAAIAPPQVEVTMAGDAALLLRLSFALREAAARVIAEDAAAATSTEAAA